jgi:hypothetical protein
VVCSLPALHQRYLFEEIRKLCAGFLRAKGRASEVTSEELLSEIWQKLLGQVALENDDSSGLPSSPTEWSTDPHFPERDGRVVWLIREIGGYEALPHRYEDILRQRFGRAQPGRGRRIVQADDLDEVLENAVDPDERSTLQEEDARRVWSGLLATAEALFQPQDDVHMLLRLLADDHSILDDSSGVQWPVRKLVVLLNERFSPPPWSGDRVDNAKRRVMNWISRLMRTNGLDATDLEGLFARVARRREADERSARCYAIPIS